MKRNAKGFVSIPEVTLNALKNMLFGAEGTDLSNIISDLSTSDNRDLTAIHVALVHKGVNIDIDKSTRYEKSWNGKTIFRHEYLGHSLILGVVEVRTSECSIGEGGDLIVDKITDNIACYGFDRWAEWTTNVADLLEK